MIVVLQIQAYMPVGVPLIAGARPDATVQTSVTVAE
jgi:hypothetical protein